MVKLKVNLDLSSMERIAEGELAIYEQYIQSEIRSGVSKALKKYDVAGHVEYYVIEALNAMFSRSVNSAIKTKVNELVETSMGTLTTERVEALFREWLLSVGSANAKPEGVNIDG